MLRKNWSIWSDAMARVITFPFRAAWFLFKWTMIAVIAFTIGVYWGR